MVQPVLILNCGTKSLLTLLLSGALLLSQVPAWAVERSETPADKSWPELLLEAGRKLTYQQSIQSERDVDSKQGFWSK
ncbi:MAG: hypothetical protein H6Q07_2963, partial [Acidobacteria bacterium]|nr:hypothetical protein [Acidobacteriota bacterium]